MLFHDGRHSRFGCLRNSVALPNWLVTRTFLTGVVVPAGRAIGKHARCARGLVGLNTRIAPVTVWTVLMTGLQCSAKACEMIGTNTLGLNWFISRTFDPAGGANLPAAV